MKPKSFSNSLLIAATALSLAGSASAVVSISDSGTTFDSNTRINTTVARVGANNNFNDFRTWYVFDINGETFTEGTLNFEVNIFSGAPTDLQVDFMGTFANGTVNLANAVLWDAASPVAVATVDPVNAPAALSLPVTGITGANNFAVFRITDPTPVTGGNEFDLADVSPLGSPGAGSFTESSVAPTLNLVPEPSSFSLIGLGGVALLLRRRK